MPVSIEQLVQEIHASTGQIVLALSGGGSGAIARLLEVPGGSRTLLEAVVPYSAGAMTRWIGGLPDAFCSSATTRAMAMAAFLRAREYQPQSADLAGVACTAGLATDRPRRGEDRIHVAVQTASRTATWSLQLERDRRTRAEEELAATQLVLNAAAETCGIEGRLELDLSEDERVEQSATVAPQPWQDLLLGNVETVACGKASTEAIFPGAFNPLHVGHRRMAQIAAEVLGVAVSLEISIVNVEKPPLDYREIESRTGQFDADQPIWLTRAATFVEKSRLFHGATFVVGTDTLRRIADARYYGDDPSACLAALERIAGWGCRFLVFARNPGTGLIRLSDLDLPEVLRSVCREIPAERFREDVSSREIRRATGHPDRRDKSPSRHG